MYERCTCDGCFSPKRWWRHSFVMFLAWLLGLYLLEVLFSGDTRFLRVDEILEKGPWFYVGAKAALALLVTAAFWLSTSWSEYEYATKSGSRYEHDTGRKLHHANRAWLRLDPGNIVGEMVVEFQYSFLSWLTPHEGRVYRLIEEGREKRLEATGWQVRRVGPASLVYELSFPKGWLDLFLLTPIADTFRLRSFEEVLTYASHRCPNNLLLWIPPTWELHALRVKYQREAGEGLIDEVSFEGFAKGLLDALGRERQHNADQVVAAENLMASHDLVLGRVEKERDLLGALLMAAATWSMTELPEVGGKPKDSKYLQAIGWMVERTLHAAEDVLAHHTTCELMEHLIRYAHDKWHLQRLFVWKKKVEGTWVSGRPHLLADTIEEKLVASGKPPMLQRALVEVLGPECRLRTSPQRPTETGQPGDSTATGSKK